MAFPLADIDLLCKVVDNFGDIGVVYRLARALSALPSPPRLRLVVDDLDAFARVAPGVDSGADCQFYKGWTVVRWTNSDDHVREIFRRRPPRLIIECFACGRPDWLEDILFDPSDAAPRLIVDLEYLTAEVFAEDFHRLPSLTRSPLVQKIFFMPGFTAKTGGLVLDEPFGRTGAAADSARDVCRRETAERLGFPADASNRFWLLVFTYERDYAKIARDLAIYNQDRPILVMAAAGMSQRPFQEAWGKIGCPYPVSFLPFLEQEAWDKVLFAADFAIIRGEDSFSRACLSGRPFLWQAYPQAEFHHLVKVRAFLDRMRPCFERSGFTDIEALFLAFNDRRHEEELLPVLRRYSEVAPGFGIFAEQLKNNGNLATNLMTRIAQIG